MGDLEVRGTHELDVRASSYELTCTLEWAAADAANDIGLEVCRAPGGGRFVSAGIEPPAARAYLDRTHTVNPGGGRTHAPLEHTAARVSLRLLVDRTSVELFVDEGRSAQSHRVFPLAGDDRIHFYARGGSAVFRDLAVRELSVVAPEVSGMSTGCSSSARASSTS